MISYVSGTLMGKGEHSVVVDHQGIGLEIQVPGSLLTSLPAAGAEVKIETYFHVKEDGMQLFGFASKQDKELFQLLITVSGIGPKGGLAIMGAMSGDDLRFAILSDDAKTIARTPGIGPKTAKKLILELKDKVDMEQSVDLALQHGEETVRTGQGETDSRKAADAVEALTALGYSATDAMRAVRAVPITEEMTVEEILKQSLKNL